MDKPDTNRDTIPIALYKVCNFVRPRMLYLDILGVAMVITKLVHSFIVVDQQLSSVQLHVLET